MTDFKKQIQEDIAEYQQKFLFMPNIHKDEWAFNFWILDKLFSIEESVIEDFIVDYHDYGIDCYVWHEDKHDLYLIQNKFYSEDSKLTVEYVCNDFLTRPLGALEKGTYQRSSELQTIYNKYHEEDDFNIHFHLYVTNKSCKYPKLIDKIQEFNSQNANKRIEAKLFSIDDIQEVYHKGPTIDKKSFNYTISTINKGTTLNINNEAYNLTLAADARYVLTPVSVIYRMLKDAKAKRYSLFNENIREYLGTSGSVNKKIAETLKNPLERNNFFFYNNGITMIVDDIGSFTTTGTNCVFSVKNPQIVNGCQTVNTIYETLNTLPESKLDKDFENTFVMIKILKIPTNNDDKKELYKNIVTYNNSQNSINEKTFAATTDLFRRLQLELEGKGFLIAIKQSDKYTFKNRYTKISSLLQNSSIFLEKFGLNHTSVGDFIIELEKLLQVFLAFCTNPTDAVQNKSKLLKVESTQHKTILEFIKNPEVTNNDKLNLLLLFLRAEADKKASSDGKSPNPFYLISWFAQYECQNEPKLISQKLSSKAEVDNIIKKYTLVFKQYRREWTKQNPDKDYNAMIKSPVSQTLQEDCYQRVLDMLMD